MKPLKILLTLGALFYTTYAYCDMKFLCDIYQGDKKLTSLPEALPERNFIGWAKDNPEAYANNVLAPSLCQTVGLGNSGKLEPVTGIRPGTRVQVFQQYASPQCILQCKLIPPP